MCIFIYTEHTHIMQTKTFILDVINRLTALKIRHFHLIVNNSVSAPE